MNLTAATPIHLLTEDQAVEELARLIDSQPPETEFLALIHWEQAHRQTINQLQAHIAHLQRVAVAQDPTPAAKQPNPAPEPVLEPAKETPMPMHRRTPTERLQTAMECYMAWLLKARQDPSDRHIRKQTSKFATHVKALAASFKLKCPEIPPLPPLPDPRVGRQMPTAVQGRAAVLPPPTVDQVLDQHLPETAPAPTPRERQVEENNAWRQETMAALEDVVEPGLESPALDKAGPGPYVEPTADDLRAALGWIPEPEPVLTGPSTRTAPLRSPCADDCTCHLHDGQMPVRPVFVPAPAPPVTDPSTLARAISRSLWPLIEALDCMEPVDRTAVRPALDAIHARLQVAYLVVDEGQELAAG